MPIYLKDLSNLCFPACCAGCNRKLLKGEEALCLHCELDLPVLHDFEWEVNVVEKLFWGKIEIEWATAVYQFKQQGTVQRLLHKIKYEGRDDVAVKLGRAMAEYVRKHDWLGEADIVVPIPLHPKRLEERGFNQCEEIGRGLVSKWNKPLVTNNLIRHQYNKSQTKKSRWDRWKNVENIFKLEDPQAWKGKHVLLLDDVITTGSTMEAAILAVKKAPDVKVSVLSTSFPTQD